MSASVATRLSRAVPIPAGAGLARMMVERNLTELPARLDDAGDRLRRACVLPVLAGDRARRTIKDVTTDGGTTVPYAVFVAPALLASSAMNGAIFDSTFNVFFKLKYSKLYDSVLATRMGPRDIAMGELCWSLLRGTFYSAAFLLVAWRRHGRVVVGPAGPARGHDDRLRLLGGGDVPHDLHAVLGGLRLREPRDPADVPLLGDVLPAVDLSRGLRWLVEITPLYQGVALERGLMLGEVDAGLLWHVGYFVVLGTVGLLGTARRLERLLLS